MTTTIKSSTDEEKHVRLTPEDFGLGLFDEDSPEEAKTLAWLRARARARSRVLAARGDVNKFAEYAFHSAETGEPLQQADIHRELQSALDDSAHRRVLVELPRNHGKTTQIVIREIHKVGNDLDRRSKIICESDKLARKRLLAIREHIESNSKVHDVFPNLKPGNTWDKTQLVVQRNLISTDPTIEACGVLGSGTGGRADELIFDDPVGFRNALANPGLRDTVRWAIFDDWMNLLEPHGRVSVAATGWTTDDAIHDMKEGGAFHVLRHPVSENYRSPWSERWTPELLKEKEFEIGSRSYQRGWLLIPYDGEIMMVQKEWINYWEIPPDLGSLSIFLAYDLAAGDETRKKKKNDYFAVCVVGVDLIARKIYILASFHARLSFLAQIERVKGDALAWHPDLIGIEATQYQAVLPQVLEALETLPKIIPIKPKLSKDLRLTGTTPQLENGTILFNPELAPEYHDKEHNDLIGEILGFPLARHDDQVDAFVHGADMASRYLLKHSYKGGGVKVIASSGSNGRGNGKVNGQRKRRQNKRQRDIFDNAESWATLDD